ncbi:DUF2510 domain-containing protein [Salinibacterium soli]|uniref:DUF2510 domain-containing protein n=1 Tax=Antiquaquibacter soli TaxID=3064523 RepID=A0ABT9BM89_9MICO|nr:DUF2510 domain-containing protein [Protaetiibacter sp. WY-16]MDO7882120.1 DUF2510 domain-containing protein [Protaetiibacter sp. WY-16]
MPTPSHSPGWYPDPDGAPGQRWWNGIGWSDARRSVDGGRVAPTAPPAIAAPPVAPAAPPSAPVVYSASNPAPQYPGQYGAAPGTPGYTPRASVTLDARQNPRAVHSFVAGLIAVFFNVLLVPSILAIVLGAQALTRSNQLRAAGQEDKTRGLAVAGFAMGVVGGVWGLIQGLIFVIGFLPVFFFDVS